MKLQATGDPLHNLLKHGKPYHLENIPTGGCLSAARPSAAVKRAATCRRLSERKLVDFHWDPGRNPWHDLEGIMFPVIGDVLVSGTAAQV